MEEIVKNILKLAAVAFCILSCCAQAGQSTFNYNTMLNSAKSNLKSIYIGGNLGLTSYLVNVNDNDGFLTDNGSFSMMRSGLNKGLQAGIDWQISEAVLGVVGELTSLDLDARIRDNPNAINNIHYAKRHFDKFYAVRLRAGLAVNNTFIYVSAGPAKAKFNTSWYDNNTAPNQVLKFNKSKTGLMGTIGAEYKAHKYINVGGEIYALRVSNQDKTFFANSNNYRFEHNDSLFGARFLVNFDFVSSIK